jgi:hypothetical protein
MREEMTNTDKARYELSDEQKKRLTLFLGECWHELKRPKDEPTVYSGKCIHCGLNQYVVRGGYPDRDRSFTTPTDAHALAKKLVEVGKWDDFGEFSFSEMCRTEWFTGSDGIRQYCTRFGKWLFAEPESPARFCYLVNAYLEEK